MTIALVMAAGNATRMAPFNVINEKSLLPIPKFKGKSSSRIIVENLIIAYAPNQRPLFDNIVVCCLDRHLDNFIWEFRDLKAIGFYSVPEPIGTSNHVIKCLNDLKMDKGQVLVHYADNITDLDFYNFLTSYTIAPRRIRHGIVVTKKARIPYSSVKVHESQGSLYASSFEEKPYLMVPTWTGIGIFDIYDLCKYVGVGLDFGKDLLPEMAKKRRLMVYENDKDWYDIGTLNHYLELNQ